MSLDKTGSVGERLLTGLTALGTTQATALWLPSGDIYAEVATVASGTGVVLPAPKLPSRITIANAGANALLVYPQPKGTIANGTANTAVSLAAGSSITYWASSPTNWYVDTTAATGSGSGTVTTVSIVTANGVSGSVANATTTPAVTLTLGAITPTSIGSATTATTQSPGDNSTKIATTAFVAAAGGSGTVTSTSVVTANGISGSVATATTTPAITLTLGAITPTTIVASSTIAGSNLSGTNTGDNAGVTSVALSTAGVLHTVSGSPVTTTGTLTLTLNTQTANTVFCGPTTGAAATPTMRALVGADLPVPSASTLGGVESIAAVSHNFLTAISTAGVPAQAQPAFTDISGSVAAAQLPTTGLTITQATLVIPTPADGATINFDLATASIFAPTALAGNRALTLTNAPASSPWVRPFTVILTQDGTGSRTITSWFTGFTLDWAGGSAPTLTLTAGKRDMLNFVQIAATTLLGSVVGQNY